MKVLCALTYTSSSKEISDFGEFFDILINLMQQTDSFPPHTQTEQHHDWHLEEI